MKKFLSGLLAALTLASCLTIPAFAADGIFPNDAGDAPTVYAVNADQFWQKNGDKLLSQDIFQYGERPFREGLMPVLVGDQWNYINEQGKVVDLNRGRFMYVFDFFEGLAAVMDKDTMKVGYIDTTGKLVIPCQYYAYDSMGGVYVGYFHDGKATVFTDGNFSETAYGGFTVKGAQVAEINKSGAKSNARTWNSDDLVGLYLIGDDGYMPDAVEIPVVEEPLTLQIVNYTGIGAGDPLDDGNYVFQNGAAYAAQATNNTTEPLNEYYALVSYTPDQSKSGTQVFFFEIDLGAGESRQYAFSSAFSGLTRGKYSFLWVKFDSKQEMQSFSTAVPFAEEQWQTEGEDRIVDSSRAAAWMQQNFGL